MGYNLPLLHLQDQFLCQGEENIRQLSCASRLDLSIEDTALRLFDRLLTHLHNLDLGMNWSSKYKENLQVKWAIISGSHSMLQYLKGGYS